MPGAFTNFLRRLGLASASKPGEAAIAAFGKHPGRDDHVELGLDTQPLAEIRQSLYVQGVAGNIDSGAWEKLAPEERLPEFNHTLLHRAGRDVCVARLWSSTD